MIHQLDLNGKDKVEKAIMRLQAYEPEEGYFLCFSGGKDSCVIKALADMAGVKYDAHYKEQRVREFERYPKYKQMYLKAFEKMIENRNLRGGYREKSDIPQTAEQVMQGYLSDKYRQENRGGGTTNTPYAKTRAEIKDFSQMTPEEIIEWWID